MKTLQIIKTAYRATIEEQASAREVEELADEIRVDLRAELREIETRLESWRIQLAAVELAQKRIDSTQLKLEAGRSTTRDLLEALRGISGDVETVGTDELRGVATTQ